MDPKASRDLTSLRPGISHYSRLPVRQLENVKGELLKLKNKEIAVCQTWHNVARTEEQRNSRLSDMAQREQERRAEETEEQRNRRLAVMGQRSQQKRAEETEEQ
ncbi:hypothetical protein AVEN_173153-1 [Araneus ventricosus]|uniref:STPR domain-containing protein n=1 Tax=Araneus ventricosus TaxID=182803 RepID=A0A4Y2KN22_ARAVE|nr:hypothetical protein AVEN_173153-1 [Araneus ventricosus]